MTYNIRCEKRICYDCNLDCIIKINNTNPYPTLVTVKYDIVVGNVSSEYTESYYVVKLFEQSIKIPMSEWSGNIFDNDRNGILIATFNPYNVQRGVEFVVDSYMDTNLIYILLGIVVVLVVVVVVYEVLRK